MVWPFGKPGPLRVVGEGEPTTFEAVTRAQLENLRDDVHDLKGRVNTLLWGGLGAILVEAVIKPLIGLAK